MNNNEIVITVSEEHLDGNASIRLDVLLQSINGFSRVKNAQVIKSGHVQLQGREVVFKPSYKVHLGDVLIMRMCDPSPQTVEPYSCFQYETDSAADIIANINGIIVVDKQPGLLVHPVSQKEYQPSIVNDLLNQGIELYNAGDIRKCGVLHRLDKSVSGLVLFVSDKSAYYHMIKVFANRKIEKFYIALCYGNIPIDNTSGDIRSFISSDSINKCMRSEILDDATKHNASSRYKVLFSFNGKAIVLIKLETGRTHQARLHMRDIGMPIIGDIKYGEAMHPYYDIHLPLNGQRTMLHSFAVAFTDYHGNRQQLFAPIHDDMMCAIKVMFGDIPNLHKLIANAISNNCN